MDADIDYPNRTISIDRNAAWFFKLRLRGSVFSKLDQKFTVRIKLLYPAIAAVGDIQVAFGVGGDSFWP